MTTPAPHEKSNSAAPGIGFKAPQGIQDNECFVPVSQAGNAFSYEWDAATGVMALSGDCAHVLGVSEGADIPGQQILSKVHPDDQERLITAFTNLTPEKPQAQIGYRLVHPDSGVIWVETNGRAIFDEAGRMLRIFGIVSAATPRNSSELEPAMANTWLHLALEAGKSVGWDWDLKSGRDSWFGDLKTMFGIPSKTYIGHVEDFRRSVHPEDREIVWKAVQYAMQNQKPYVVDFRIIRQDGTIRWVAAQGKFYYSSDGEPERMLGIAVDITERKGAEEALQQKDSELAEAQRLTGVGSWQWDPENDIVIWSDELYRITGRDPKLPAVNYKEHSQLYTAESWERLRHAVEEAVRTGAQYELELEMIRADGATRWVIARGEPQRDTAGRIVRLRGTLQDITEHKLAEEALSSVSRRLIEAQETERMRIARDLHDDIGQRLALLSVTLEQTKQVAIDSDEVRSRFDELRRQILNMSAAVHTLSHELHSSTLRYLDVGKAMRGLCTELSKKQKVEINFSNKDIAGTVPKEISLCLFRVLQEALHNAVKHSGVRHFDVELRGTLSDLHLTVRDSGFGFDLEAMKCRGLGLNSMHERLKLVDGELTIDSQPGRGTTIHARVPLALGKASAQPAR